MTVTGQDDGSVDGGDIVYTIITAPAVAIGELTYDGFDPDDVMMINDDNDI